MECLALHWQADSYPQYHQQSPKYKHFERSILYHIKKLKFQLCHGNFPMSYERSVLLVMSPNKQFQRDLNAIRLSSYLLSQCL